MKRPRRKFSLNDNHDLLNQSQMSDQNRLMASPSVRRANSLKSKSRNLLNNPESLHDE